MVAYHDNIRQAALFHYITTPEKLACKSEIGLIATMNNEINVAACFDNFQCIFQISVRALGIGNKGERKRQ